MVDRSGEFNPDWRSPPGDTILDLIVELAITAEHVRLRLGLSEQEMNKLIAGELQIDETIANRLSLVFGCSAEFWRVREQQFREPRPR